MTSNGFIKNMHEKKNILFDTSFSIMRCKTETLDYYCEALRNGFSNLCFGSDFLIIHWMITYLSSIHEEKNNPKST